MERKRDTRRTTTTTTTMQRWIGSVWVVFGEGAEGEGGDRRVQMNGRGRCNVPVPYAAGTISSFREYCTREINFLSLENKILLKIFELKYSSKF
jgi:hypothetical protein